MARDIDYAAIAVQKAIVERFGHRDNLQGLRVTANGATLSLSDDDQTAEGSRDDLLAVIRAADSYAKLWELLAIRHK